MTGVCDNDGPSPAFVSLEAMFYEACHINSVRSPIIKNEASFSCCIHHAPGLPRCSLTDKSRYS